MNPEVLRVRSSDGAETDATIYPAAASAPLVLIWPAMGVAARYYLPLAGALAAAGFNAATVDLRGIGSSSLRASRRVDFGYADMVEKDWPAALAAVKSRFPGAPVVLLGHSLGGQMSALHAARQPESIRALLLIASGSVYYKGWSGMARWSTLFFTQIAAALATLLGYFPGHRIGFGGLEARTVMRDWARMARSGRFLPAGTDFDYESALTRLRLPVLGLSFARDSFASRQAMHNLLAKMPATAVRHEHLRAEDSGGVALDHFNWVKRPELIVPRIKGWIEDMSSRAQRGI